MAWKYVIVRHGNREIPVIFPTTMVHSEMAEVVKDYYAREIQFLCGRQLPEEVFQKVRSEIVPVSAGECEIDVLSSSGRSETLNLSSRPVDHAMMNMHPYSGGYVSEESDATKS